MKGKDERLGVKAISYYLNLMVKVVLCCLPKLGAEGSIMLSKLGGEGNTIFPRLEGEGRIMLLKLGGEGRIVLYCPSLMH